MRFWDTSAIVPLLVAEPATGRMTAEYEQDPEIVAWWGTDIECTSALTRLERDGTLAGIGGALARLDALSAAWHEIQPATPVRRTAIRLLRVHPLRAADSLQLAAAIVASEGDPASLPILTLDERLARAAEREGFRVVEGTGPAS